MHQCNDLKIPSIVYLYALLYFIYFISSPKFGNPERIRGKLPDEPPILLRRSLNFILFVPVALEFHSQYLSGALTGPLPANYFFQNSQILVVRV